MLQELSIRNFAIIEDLTLELGKGLTILSGETGAGKSIIINAFNLLLGARASAALIRTGAESAELEAFFDIPVESKVAHRMLDMGYEPSDGLMIRRIVSNNDRHRIYINGRLATIQVLSELTARLAGISGQHAHQGLLREEEHLSILDQFDGLQALRAEYAQMHGQLLPLIRKEQELVDRQGHLDEQLALLRFQSEEIEQAAIQPNEDELLEKERRRLKNGAALYHIVQECTERLYSSEGAVVETLFALHKALAKAADLDGQLTESVTELEALGYRSEDLATSLTAYLKRIDLDPQQLEDVEARLDLLNKLKRKYGGSLQTVIAHGQKARQNLEEMDNLEGSLATLRADLAVQHQKVCDLARHLSGQRQVAAGRLARQTEAQLAELKMANTRFEVVLQQVKPSKETGPYLICDGGLLGEAGLDRAIFMIAPNVGEAIKPLAAIASGGELSRVVLALKALLAGNDAVETIVFDEVDAGIGGGVADRVGRKLAALAQRHQVLCITHLAQIARYGDQHFQIRKNILQGRTYTTIAPLTDQQRVEEIARMLGGDQITEVTLAHAREMLAHTTMAASDGSA